MVKMRVGGTRPSLVRVRCRAYVILPQIDQVEEIIIAQLPEMFRACSVVDKDHFSGTFDTSRLLIARTQPLVSSLG